MEQDEWTTVYEIKDPDCYTQAWGDLYCSYEKGWITKKEFEIGTAWVESDKFNNAVNDCPADVGVIFQKIYDIERAKVNTKNAELERQKNSN